MGEQVFLASSRKDFCLNGERFACDSQKVPSVEGSTALVREVWVKKPWSALPCGWVLLQIAISSKSSNPNEDFVQERNDQVHRLRKAWSSQIFLFWVLRSCKFPPTKPLGLCEDFEITLTSALNSVFCIQKTGTGGSLIGKYQKTRTSGYQQNETPVQHCLKPIIRIWDNHIAPD